VLCCGVEVVRSGKVRFEVVGCGWVNVDTLGSISGEANVTVAASVAS